MSGLKRLCKLYGQINVTSENGEKVTWVWDYKNDKPRLKHEMTKNELAESEKVKWSKYRNT